jgi:uncharacterized protein (TIGR00288 family)
MRQTQETTLALFIDFDNVALGAREAGLRFDVNLLLQRLLEKGKVIVKKAYADWGHYKEYMADLHGAAIELIEIPSPKVSGKNSADIRLVVDAMELCYAKAHLDTFVIVSGDSDFSPLVSKLRENNKSVIGSGMRNSSSRLLIANCDEFIFYDDLAQGLVRGQKESLAAVPEEKRKLFDFLLTTIRGLMQDGREELYSSLIKDTMKRKRPDFNEGNYGYSTFGHLLEDAKVHELLMVERDQRAGGTWVVTALEKPGAQSRSAGTGRRVAGVAARRRVSKKTAGTTRGGATKATPASSGSAEGASTGSAAAGGASGEAVAAKTSRRRKTTTRRRR